LIFPHHISSFKNGRSFEELLEIPKDVQILGIIDESFRIPTAKETKTQLNKR
jgi:hypothetical protein